MPDQPLPKYWRRLLRISVRGLMVLVLVLGGVLGWFSWFIYRARLQGQAVAAIRGTGGVVLYDWEWKNRRLGRNDKPRGPQWLLDHLGADYLNQVVYASLSEPASDQILAQIGQIDGLEMLWLVGSQVTGTGPSRLPGLTRLRTLCLARTPVTNSGLSCLEGMHSLETLYLQGTAVTDAGLAHLKSLTQLELLDLSGTAVTDAGLAHLKGLNQLKTLSLFGTQINGPGLAHLGGLKRLDRLSLRATSLDDAGMAHLESLTGLRSLDLTNDTRVTSVGLSHLKGLTELQSVSLHNVKFNSVILRELRRALPKLKMDY